ncbi:MAG: aminopeptidase P family N-terminal domain-containing protein, partial [Chloroflexota bacterium]
MIIKQHAEYTSRIEKLQAMIQAAGLDMLLVSSQDSIYYLTGLTYDPLERPFFILVPPVGEFCILSPHMEHVHIRASLNVSNVETYWEYPSPAGQGWHDRLSELLLTVQKVGVGFAGRLGLYRILMLFAVLVFGWGGVITHLANYAAIATLYHSTVAWGIAILINLFGLGLNILAASGGGADQRF